MNDFTSDGLYIHALTAVLNLVADDDADAQRASAPPAAQKAANGSAPKLATAADVDEMRASAHGLEPDQIRMALEACGISGVTVYNKVPADKVAALAKTLAEMERS